MYDLEDAGSVTGTPRSAEEAVFPAAFPARGPLRQHNLLIITPSGWPERCYGTSAFVLPRMLSKHSWNSNFLFDLHGNSRKTILKMSGETASNGGAFAKENILQF